jgi:D-3-phosphoglycerate dehydrogenase
MATSNGNGEATRPKVLIPEKVSPDGLRMLQATLDVHERKGLTPEELKEIIGDYDALIVRSETKVTADLLSAGKKLRVVARAGVGVDNVDLEAATKLGVIVVNSPQGNINAAAEHTIALIMASARNVGLASASLKVGKWERSKFVGVEVKGKTLSILGLGKGVHVMFYIGLTRPLTTYSRTHCCTSRWWTRNEPRSLRPIRKPISRCRCKC